MIALRHPVSLSRVEDELVLDPEPGQRPVENVAWPSGTFVSSSPCRISTGVRTFDANEIGLC